MSPLRLKKDLKRLTPKLGTPSRGPLGYGSPDFNALMFLVGHCYSIPVICTIITATAVLYNMCIYDKTLLPDHTEQPPHEPDLVIELPAHLHNNAGVLVRDHLTL